MPSRLQSKISRQQPRLDVKVPFEGEEVDATAEVAVTEEVAASTKVDATAEVAVTEEVAASTKVDATAEVDVEVVDIFEKEMKY